MQLKKLQYSFTIQKGIILVCNGLVQDFSHYGTHSEVCHPRCVFKLYGEVNSVKNTTINIWLNDGVY